MERPTCDSLTTRRTGLNHGLPGFVRGMIRPSGSPAFSCPLYRPGSEGGVRASRTDPLHLTIDPGYPGRLTILVTGEAGRIRKGPERGSPHDPRPGSVRRGRLAIATHFTVALSPLLSARSDALGQAVTIGDEPSAFTLSNGIVTARVSKRSGDLTSLQFKGTETLNDRSGHAGGYWSHDATGGKETVTRVTIDPKANGGERGEVSEDRGARAVPFAGVRGNGRATPYAITFDLKDPPHGRATIATRHLRHRRTDDRSRRQRPACRPG